MKLHQLPRPEPKAPVALVCDPCQIIQAELATIVEPDEFDEDQDLKTAMSLLDRWLWVGKALELYYKAHPGADLGNDVDWEIAQALADTQEFVSDFDEMERGPK